MAIWSICDEDRLKNMTSQELISSCDEYCNWCWGHGYGNCDLCRKYYKHLLYLKKMEEFKNRRVEGCS